MIRETRHPRRATTREEALDILRKMKYGVLATVNEEGEPRATAVNYFVVDDNTLLFHSAKIGEKMDNLRQNSAVSFFVVESQKIKQGEFSEEYLSVAIQGHAEIVDEDKKFAYLTEFAKSQDKSVTDEQIKDYTYPSLIGKVAVVLIHIDNITGKRHE